MKNKHMEEKDQEMLSLCLMMFRVLFQTKESWWFFKALAAVVLEEKTFQMRTVPNATDCFL